MYNKDEGEDCIALREEKDAYLLIIEDQRYGIHAKDLPHVVERFYRANKARSRKNGGTCLGLAIMKLILDIHHYDIVIQSKVDENTTVTIRIPK